MRPSLSLTQARSPREDTEGGTFGIQSFTSRRSRGDIYSLPQRFDNRGPCRSVAVSAFLASPVVVDTANLSSDIDRAGISSLHHLQEEETFSVARMHRGRHRTAYPRHLPPSESNDILILSN